MGTAQCPKCGGELDGGCVRYACPEAVEFRKRLVAYLEKQLTADLAVVSWCPMFITALMAATWESTWLGFVSRAAGAGLLAVLVVPIASVLRKRAMLRREAVGAELVMELARVRHERKRSFFHRHRPLIAKIEDRVTNPVLFVGLATGAAKAFSHGSVAGGALCVVLMGTAFQLYLGPSRRALENPIRDYEAWRAASDDQH